MAKTYVHALKYMIRMDFQVDGIVDKPDIIGAVFGQSEGLLGEEMDLKELQKAGKIGRIEIDSHSGGGKTNGKMFIPSSMDMVETSILAAAMESVDKVGPCQAVFKVEEIEDTRSNKRAAIKERAKELLKRLKSEQMPEPEGFATEVRETARTAKLKSFGRSRLPAGPDVPDADEIIVCEGRADVVNLLKHNIANAVGMEGSKISKDIINLCQKKSCTVFVDGDRGGELIARKLQQMTKVDFIARAPDGKEVEELQGKEIHQALAKKVSSSEDEGPRRDRFEGHDELRQESREGYRDFDRREDSHGYGDRGMRRFGDRGNRGFGDRDRRPFGGRGERGGFGSRPSGGFGRDRGRDSRGMRGRDGMRERGGFGSRPSGGFGRDRGGMRGGRGMRSGLDRGRGFGRGMGRDRMDREMPVETGPTLPQPTPEETKTYQPLLRALKGSLKAKFLDENAKEVKELPVKDVVDALDKEKGVHAVVFDGVITKRLAMAAEKAGVKVLVGIRCGRVEDVGGVKAMTMSTA